jgi:hypothetical protein
MQGNHICDNGVDIDPPSALAANANATGPCVAKPVTETASKSHFTEKPHAAGASGAHKGRRHE